MPLGRQKVIDEEPSRARLNGGNGFPYHTNGFYLQAGVWL